MRWFVEITYNFNGQIVRSVVRLSFFLWGVLNEDPRQVPLNSRSPFYTFTIYMKLPVVLKFDQDRFSFTVNGEGNYEM